MPLVNTWATKTATASSTPKANSNAAEALETSFSRQRIPMNLTVESSTPGMRGYATPHTDGPITPKRLVLSVAVRLKTPDRDPRGLTPSDSERYAGRFPISF